MPSYNTLARDVLDIMVQSSEAALIEDYPLGLEDSHNAGRDTILGVKSGQGDGKPKRAHIPNPI